MKSYLSVILIALSCHAYGVQKGGTLNLPVDGEPTSLHPISSGDGYASDVTKYIFDSLLDTDIDTYLPRPRMAEKYEVSKDGKTITFTIREGLKFSDGTPVTLEDIKFSFDWIMDPRFKAFGIQPYFENFEKYEILPPNQFRIHIKKKYHQNLGYAGSNPIVPKKFYENPEQKRTKEILGSGPYKLAKWDKGTKLTIERNPNWFGWNLKDFEGQYNFDKIVFKVAKDSTIALEMFKKGEIDFVGLTPEQYVKKTDGPGWGSKWIKVKTENKSPKSYGYIGWNLKHPILKDKNVRRALSHLMDRNTMNEKFRFGMSQVATGPVNPSSDYANPNVKPLLLDVDEATRLLKKAGWTDDDKNGVLEKIIDGKKTELRITVTVSSEDFNRYFTVWKEDAKKAGVDLVLKQTEWNTIVKLIDEQKFEGLAMAWSGGSVDVDLKQIFHSDYTKKGGSNYVGYSNKEVDQVIDQAREELDKQKRIPMIQKMHALISDDAPYTFMFFPKFVLYAHNSRIKKPKDTWQYSIGQEYWWSGK